MKKSSKSQNSEPSFEESLAELEKTVAELESGRLGLDDALARHARGVEVLTRCRALLDTAARKVSLLVQVDDDGEPVLAPFDSVRETPAPAPFVEEIDYDDDDDLAPF